MGSFYPDEKVTSLRACDIAHGVAPSDCGDFGHVAARHEELRYRIAPDCKVQIRFNGVATQEAIRKLINYLEMGIGDFPRNADNSATQD